MLQQRIGYLALMLAGVLLAGCQSAPPVPEPTPPAPEPAPTTAPPAAPPAFNPNLEPYYPGTTRLLERTFYFDFDEAVIRPADLAALEVHARVLRDNPQRQVMVEGHCDERGTREYNLALGERRADAVKSFLTASGVPASRVESVSYGEERPDDPGHTEAAWSRNRRAVLIYR